MQKADVSLKKAASELNINYSTAKTIVQTYRREKRISKRPKHIAETKKTLRREKLLAKMLTQNRVRKLTNLILKTTLGHSKKKRNKGRMGISEVRTLPVTAQPSENPISKGFPRVESAGQMVLFEPETPGPKCGQVSRGVMINREAGVTKKDIFYVHYNPNSEEEFKESINNPIVKKHISESKKNLLSTINEQKVDTSFRDTLKACGSAFTFINKRSHDDNSFAFNFHFYSTMIMNNAYQRYSNEMNVEINKR